MPLRNYYVLVLAGLAGCSHDATQTSPAPSASAIAVTVPSATAAPSASAAVPEKAGCAEGMLTIPGGVFMMGAPFAVGLKAPDHLHKVAVRGFCLDLTEVSAATYNSCVQSGGCTAGRHGFSCTGDIPTKQSHPINCVDWFQATAACKAWGKRLPSEEEWEYAARGGAEARTYSWGEAEPSEAISCYNHPGTCPVKSYAAGAFGLHDMMGNVWEWTSSRFLTFEGWELPDDWRVYRGGSFSRRFPKWMKGWLRNRFRQKEFGGHLGFRCATDQAGSLCPEGSKVAEDGGTCVLDAAETPSRPLVVAGGSAHALASAAPPETKEPQPAVLSRDTRYDADCTKYKPGRPVCYLVKGGSFADRQRIGKGMNCQNRDVGMDYNSLCCPGGGSAGSGDGGVR